MCLSKTLQVRQLLLLLLVHCTGLFSLFFRRGFQSWQGSTGLLSVKDARLPSKLAYFASQVHMFNKFMLFFVSLNTLHHQMCNA